MGVHPHAIIISEDVFKRPECPKHFEEHVKNIGNDFKINGKSYYKIAWCEHYMSDEWDDMEEEEDVYELKGFKDEYTSDDDDVLSARVDNWLNSLRALNKELVF